MLREWETLPDFMKNRDVKEYYEIIYKRRFSLRIKRIFDFCFAMVLLIICAIPMAIIAMVIVMDSKGSPFYRQERVTTYGKKFRIHKFRTMVIDAEQLGSSVTTHQDKRVTRVGVFLRKFRLDELPQLIDVLVGHMSFVGTRPEVTKYVENYTSQMCATLLLPAGITSEASIRYKDEADLLNEAEDVDKVYIEQVLPQKMKYNLESIKNFNFGNEILTMLRTILAVFGKEYK